ncbi:MAG: bifunctional protein-serine/threonine kinase/phosphatase, partial [Methylocystis sp.]
LFDGDVGDEASDQFAFGVTVYRMFSRSYPYGEIEPFSTPRFTKPLPLAQKRPDLPAWLDAAILKAIGVEPRDRFGDVLEFAFELENGSARAQPLTPRKKSLYERNPIIFWQTLCLLLTLLLAISIFYR